MTIHEIAKANAKAGRHYFSKRTLDFFGQKLGDFVVLEKNDRVFVYCDTHRRWNSEDHLSSFAEFHKDTGRMGLKSLSPKGTHENWTLTEAKAYVDSLGEVVCE